MDNGPEPVNDAEVQLKIKLNKNLKNSLQSVYPKSACQVA